MRSSNLRTALSNLPKISRDLFDGFKRGSGFNGFRWLRVETFRDLHLVFPVPFPAHAYGSNVISVDAPRLIPSAHPQTHLSVNVTEN